MARMHNIPLGILTSPDSWLPISWESIIPCITTPYLHRDLFRFISLRVARLEVGYLFSHCLQHGKLGTKRPQKLVDPGVGCKDQMWSW